MDIERDNSKYVGITLIYMIAKVLFLVTRLNRSRGRQFYFFRFLQTEHEM